MADFTEQSFTVSSSFLPDRRSYVQFLAEIQQHLNGDGPPRRRGASKASIDSMPAIIVSESDGLEDCSICLAEFMAGDEERKMPCNHAYHSGCIEKWLENHATCPLCRFVMQREENAGDDEEFEGGGESRNMDPVMFESLMENGAACLD